MAAAVPSPLASSAEKTNGAKLSRLLIDGGTTVLRNAFDNCHPPANLASDLNANYSTLNNLLKKRVIRQAQWDQLFPPGGAKPDSNSFDITLLFLLLTSICGLPPPLLGWHTKPVPSDTSLQANLARIKFFRNELYGHVSSTSVDTPTFKALWQEISAVLVALGLDQAELDRLQAERCGEDDYIDVLTEWADSEQEIKSELKEIKLDVKKVLQTQLEDRGKESNYRLEQVHQTMTKTHQVINETRQTQLEDQNSLHDTVSKLDELHQIENETYQTLKDVSQAQLEDHKMLQHSISKLEGISETQTKTQQAVEDFQAGLQEVKQKVESLNKKREMDRAAELLRSLAKSEFIGDIEYHAQRFQEGTREWIFKRVEDWLDDRNSPNRVMVISGNAGIGKSVISAVTCKRMQQAGRLSGSHFCQHNNVRYRKPQLMLQSLASHLSNTLPEYNKSLVEQLSRNLGPVELNSMGVEELFALLFKEPLNIVKDPGRNILMVIDGLDESEYQGRNELLGVIANQFSRLPQWIRFFVTTRSEINIADSLKHLQPIHIDENQEEHSKDIQLFFEMRLSPKIAEEQKDVLLTKLVEKSEGVFLYAYFLIDHIQENVPFLTLDLLESILPLGISSVYLSHFKRLENELIKELKIDEDQALSFLSAFAASREPLPVAFVSRLLNPIRRSLSLQRRTKKAMACISSLLPVRDHRVHFFHKSVKDWLTNTSCYGEHDFTVNEKEGHEILFRLCSVELDDIKQKDLNVTQFTNTEKYALQHGVQHMIEGGKLSEGSVLMYVANLELIYAKLCISTANCLDELSRVQMQVNAAMTKENHVAALIDALFLLLRKHSYILRDYPHLFFQCLLNEGGPEISSRAASLLKTQFPDMPYMKYLEDHADQFGPVQARFYCSDTVACFDVSPKKDFMVCECRDGTIHLWCLQTGNLQWIRPALTMKNFYSGKPSGSAYRHIRECLSFYRSVVFHPDGNSILPGTLRNVYTLRGDSISLFPDKNSTFSNCVFSGDKKIILTDCPGEPKRIVIWSIESGEQVTVIDCEEEIVSFSFSRDGTLIAISDYFGHIFLLDREKRCVGLISGFEAACGLMRFISEKNTLACGVLRLTHDKYYGPIFETYFCERPKYTLFSSINKALQPTSSDCHEVTQESGKLVLWPFESSSLTEHDFRQQRSNTCWVNNLQNIFPFLLTAGFYFQLDEETALVGSPAFKYVAVVNIDKLSDMNSASGSERVIEVEFSAEGNTIYVISEVNDINQSVTVLRMSDRHILVKKPLSELVALIPAKVGVVLFEEHKVPELWNFELDQCIRSFTKLSGKEMIFPISKKLIACQRNFPHTLHMTGSAFPQSVCTDGKEREDFSFLEGFPPFTPIPNEAIAGPFVDHMARRDVPMELIVDILDVAEGVFVSSVKTMVPGRKDYLFVSLNSHHQLLLCTSEDIHVPGQFWDELVVTISLSSNSAIMWERSSVWYDSLCRKPGFMLSPEEEFVVTWRTLEAGYGIHILDAKTGETRHVLLKDHAHYIIAGCKFVGDGKSLVCCSRDNFLRLFNVRSGDLLSVVDIGEVPYSLGACLGKSLVAIALSGSRLKFIHVELPSIKDAGEKKGLKCLSVNRTFFYCE